MYIIVIFFPAPRGTACGSFCWGYLFSFTKTIGKTYRDNTGFGCLPLIKLIN